MTAAGDIVAFRVSYWPSRLLVFLFASLSIGSLLLYFAGVGRFNQLAPALLGIETAGLLVIVTLAHLRRRGSIVRLVAGGLWAGCLATLVYDVVRVPLVHARLPLFKAISYFGMVMLGADRPSVASDILGWGYHLSNGVSFGLMYASIALRPRVISAIVWGLSLEAIMLLTPYAEVFGYRRDAKFLTITLTSHALYGAALWLALKHYAAIRPRWRVAGVLGVPLVLALLAADFHGLYAGHIPAAPPPYIGPHLYTCWNSPEPDRVAVLWITKRFRDPAAEFYFIEPFDKIRFGTPLDVPEAVIRRQGTLSASEVLVSRSNIRLTPRLELLVRTTHLAEVTPWAMIADREASEMANELRQSATESCGGKLRADCLPSLFAYLDHWYGGQSR